MQACIMRLKNPEQAKENVLRASELVYIKDLKYVRSGQFTYYIRDVNTDHEHLLREIEQHFNFPKRAS